MSVRRTVTIREVAECAGVSVGTVSNVFSGSAAVKEVLRERVLGCARTLGYKPNKLAQDFRKRRTTLIGMIIPDIANPFFPAVVRGVEDTASQFSYRVLLCNTDNNPHKEAQYLEEMRAHCVAGVILIPAYESHMEASAALRRDGIAIVALDRALEHWFGDTVTVNNSRGAEDAVAHLLQLGHRRVAIIAGSMQLSNARARYEGFCRAMRKSKADILPGYVQEGHFNRQTGFEKMRLLLHLQPRPTAVFATNDLIALGAMTAIRDAGLNCPGDISVIGFDDLEFSELAEPALSTVAQPGYQMGAQGAHMLMKRMKNARGQIQHIILPTELKIRHSSAPPPTEKTQRKR